MRFWKYHGLGNDYAVLHLADWPDGLTPEMVRLICDRHFGLGSDGLLLTEARKGDTSFQVRIMNPDGSEAEKSGNGLRILSRYLRVPYSRTTPVFRTGPMSSLYKYLTVETSRSRSGNAAPDIPWHLVQVVAQRRRWYTGWVCATPTSTSICPRERFSSTGVTTRGRIG